MLLFGVICYPLSKVLDLVLGEHDITRFKNDQLKELVSLHSRRALEDIHFAAASGDIGLTHIQSQIISGAFDLSHTKVITIITPMDKLYTLSIDAVVNE
jgi:metal transporter CNNM